MSSATRRILDLFDRIDVTPIGPEERAMIDEAIRLAEEAGEERLAYRARMRLTASAMMTGDTEAMIASFSWCSGRNLSDPVRFPAQTDDQDILFQYKWMASSLAAHPRFGLDRIESVHRDMEERYRQAGAGLSGVLQSRFWIALTSGDLEAAARLRDERDALPRDEYSHCEACVRSEDAWYHQVRGDDEEALRVFDDIMENGYTCGEEPENSQADALLPLLRAGRLDDARAAHLSGYRAARHNPDGLGMVARHLVFCAVTGNEARGLQLLERHIRQLANDPLDLRTPFVALLSAAVLLDAVTATGHGETLVRGADDAALVPFIGGHDGAWRAAGLADAAWAAASAIGARFDERNGNDHHARTVERYRALGSFRVELPIDDAGFVPDPLERSAAPAAATAAEWLDAAREGLSLGRPEDAIAAADRGWPSASSDQVPTFWGIVVQANLLRGDRDSAEAALAERIAALRAAGRSEQAELEERTGFLLHGDAGADEIPVLRAELDAARTAGAADDVLADLLLTTAIALLGAHEAGEDEIAAAVGLGEEAVAVASRAGANARIAQSARWLATQARLRAGDLEAAARHLEEVVAGETVRPIRAAALSLRAQLAANAGQIDRAIADAEDALALAGAAGDRNAVIGIARLAASLHAQAGDPERAVRRARAALRALEAAEDQGELPGLLFMLGRLQLDAGQSVAALETFDDLYKRESDADEEPGSVAQTLYWLGIAAQESEEYGLAYGAWQRAIAAASAADAHQVAALAGDRLGGMLLGFGDEDALEVLERALESADRSDDDAVRVQVQHTLGRARLAGGDENGLVDLDAARERAASIGADWAVADILDSTARGLPLLGRGAEAVSLALQAADGYAEAGDVQRAFGAELFAARTAAEGESPSDAVALYTAALDRVEEGSALHGQVSEELEGLRRRLA